MSSALVDKGEVSGLEKFGVKDEGAMVMDHCQSQQYCPLDCKMEKKVKGKAPVCMLVLNSQPPVSS